MRDIPHGSQSFMKRNSHLFPKEPMPDGEGVERESDLHDDILRVCRERGWICFHGSMAHRSRRTLGEPDVHCLLPNGVIIFVECKRKKSKLSLEQAAIMTAMKRLGHTLHVVQDLTDFMQICAAALSAGKLEMALSFPKSNAEAKANTEYLPVGSTQD